MKSFIFNADDYGLSEKTNHGILQCFTRGIVRSVSTFVNFPNFMDSWRLLENTKISAGIHLNVSGAGFFFTKEPGLFGRNGKIYVCMQKRVSLSQRGYDLFWKSLSDKLITLFNKQVVYRSISIITIHFI